MQNPLALLVVVGTLALFTVSCSAPSPTEPVLGEVKPLNAGDVEGALAYWTDDATVKLVGVPPGVPDSYRGKEQVRAWFKELVASHFQIQVEVQKIEGDTVTTKTLSWQDMTRQMNIAPLIATEVYIVKNGKIASLTWTITPESLAKMQAAMAEAQKKSPEAVFKAITEALNKKDVETATALLADDVTQTLIPAPSGTGIYKGKETMRARFKEVIALNAYHKFSKCDTSGDKITCAVTYSDDSTKPLGFDLEMKAEAVVQNGLLKTVTWTVSGQSLAKMQAAMAKTQPQTMTVTFAGNKCAYAGPKQVPAGKITVNLNVEGQGNVGYGLFMATLDKGKTINDLIPVPALPQPDWVHEVDKVGPFSSSRTMITLAEVKEGPIYLICFTWEPLTKIGVLGPIDLNFAQINGHALAA